MPDQPAAKVSTYWKSLGRTLPQLLLIVLLGTLVYSNTFHSPFVLDDETSITDNPVIRHLGSFLNGDGYAYNPRRFVGYLTFALNYHFGGIDVWGYHLVNLGIHLASALLIYFLLRLALAAPFFERQGLGARDKGLDTEPGLGAGGWGLGFVPLYAALLFVVHPVQTGAVTYIVQRFASLCSMFYLATVVCYLGGRLALVRGKLVRAVPWFTLAASAALLALRTKENAATLPLLLAALEFSFFGCSRKKVAITLSLTALLAVALSALLFFGKPLADVLAQLDSMSRETTTISRGAYLITQFCVIVTYLRLLILPVNQSLEYDYPVYHSLFQARPLLSLLLLAALAALSAHLYCRSAKCDGKDPDAANLRLAAFGIVWFFITLLVESSVIPIRDVIYEHRLYLPAAGILLAFASLLPVAARRLPRRATAAFCCAVIVALSVAAYARNEAWRSDVAIWQDASRKAPAKARPHHNLARAYKEREMLPEAEREYLTALRLDPSSSDACTNLGVIYRHEGYIEKAIEMHKRAMELGANNPSPRLNLGVVYATQGKYAEAEALFREALAINPQYADAHLNLGHLYRLQGELQKAEDEYRMALRLDPLNAVAADALRLLPPLTVPSAVAAKHPR